MPEKIIIFDTTMRDGEQSPGASMTCAEKLAIADLLDNIGVDVIEAGFAAASEGDFKAVKAVAQQVKNATVCSLARAIDADIVKAAHAVEGAKNPRIHTFISTSEVHLKHQLGKSQTEVLKMIERSVALARKHTADVEWSAMDATRTEIGFLCEAIKVAIENGATTINIPDTVGFTVPQEFMETINIIKEKVAEIENIIISVHCHNDLGLATANAISAFGVGAKQVECTINGIGERAGNTSLEEVVMALKTRKDILPYDVSHINTKYIKRASDLVARITGFAVQKNKAIVGANAFAHESGIHQDGVLKERSTYEIINPSDIGIKRGRENTIVLGKHSGRHAFADKLSELGICLEDGDFQKAFLQFKTIADRKKTIYDDDILALIDDNFLNAGNYAEFLSLEVYSKNGEHKVKLGLNLAGEEVCTETNSIDGVIDAIVQATRQIIPHNAGVGYYGVNAVTEGKDAQAEVTFRLDHKELTDEDGEPIMATGKSSDTDTMVASAKAYISALNKLLNMEPKAKTKSGWK